MRRYAGAFGLLGFLVVLATGLLGERPLTEVLWRALAWGGGFALLGVTLAWIVQKLMAEVNSDSEYQEGGTVAVSAERAAKLLSEKVEELISSDQSTPEKVEETQIADKGRIRELSRSDGRSDA